MVKTASLYKSDDVGTNQCCTSEAIKTELKDSTWPCFRILQRTGDKLVNSM